MFIMIILLQYCRKLTFHWVRECVVSTSARALGGRTLIKFCLFISDQASALLLLKTECVLQRLQGVGPHRSCHHINETQVDYLFKTHGQNLKQVLDEIM